MNLHCFRIVFNAHRGQMMAVAETAPAQGKTTGESTGGSTARRASTARRWPLVTLVSSLSLYAAWPSDAWAQIAASKDAPGNQRATVLSAGNGVPVVNVQTPSAAGVSRNTYSQFDVGSNGVVLNNSREGAQTQLAGQVAGNPWMARGTAKIILNEVVSNDPSKLKGVIEVGGARAEVVIANPSGVEVDGAGFINASRATITTGKPNLKDGKLEGYEVRQGIVTIQAGGLDASQTDYTAVLARAVKVNGAIHAKELKVVTGANQISADHKQIKPIAGTGPAPEFALDVSQLGGMYAGKITLIGTEAGVGVRNSGKIVASAGEVSITADGRLVNTGQIVSHGNADFSVNAGFENQGSAYARGSIKVSTRRYIHNSGLIGALGNVTLVALDADSEINSTAGSTLAAGLLDDGSFAATGELTLSAASRVLAQGTNRAPAKIAVSSETISLSNSHSSSPLIRLVAMVNSGRARVRRNAKTGLFEVINDGDTNSANSADGLGIDLAGATILADELLQAWTDGSMRTDEAHIRAGQLDLSALDLSNRSGEMAQTGTGALTLTLPGMLDNTEGTIFGATATTIRAANLLNDGGKLVSAVSLTVRVDGQLDNGKGTIAGASSTQVDTISLDNAGTIDGAVSTVSTLNNTGTIVGAAQAGGALNNSKSIGGAASAGTTLTNSGDIWGAASAAQALNNSGWIGQNAKAGTSLDNTGTIVGSAGASGDINNIKTIGGSVTAGASLNNSGAIGGTAMARLVLNNSGFIDGHATAGDSLKNSGTIVGAALAATALDNTRAIGGSAAAGTDLSNAGSITGPATAARDLSNEGWIGELATAGGKLSNSGTVVGGASAGGELHNIKSIGGGASAGTDLSNTGDIFGTASAAHDLSNSGWIGELAKAGNTLSNSGAVVGAASSGADLRNLKSIGGAATSGANLSNDGDIFGAASAVHDLSNSGWIGALAKAGNSLVNAGTIVGAASSGGDLSNSKSIGASATAGANLTNAGDIFGAASALHDLSNSGWIGELAKAGNSLVNSGTIVGAASSGGDLSNSKSIGASATAGASLSNTGDILGSASAALDLRNTGAIGGSASAKAELTNAGWIGDAAQAGTKLSNTGDIAGAVQSGGELSNSRLIGGSVSAGTTLTNLGSIAGNASSSSLNNAGNIAGSASAQRDLSNAGWIGAAATAGARLTNSGGIGGNALATSLTNLGSIAGSAAADRDLDNSGSIGDVARAGTSLVNTGAIAGAASAGQDLSSSGVIGGAASAGSKLGNSGSIGGNATAGGSLINIGQISGAAVAQLELSNAGHIGDSAKAGTSLQNSGVIAGAATAASSLSNAGVIGGAASAAQELDNQGRIGGTATAGNSLTNLGEIVGTATAGKALNNAGAIGGAAQAGTRLVNLGLIGGSASASTDLHNEGLIGGGASATQELTNLGRIGGTATAGNSLTNLGEIVGTATAGKALDNAGAIGGAAQAGTRLVNLGLIVGGASASTDLRNEGGIGGAASAGLNLTNLGAIDGAVSAIRDLDNSGWIGGSASTLNALNNTGAIGGIANAGGTLNNAGWIGRWASAGASLENTGVIVDSAAAGRELVNYGYVGDSVSAKTMVVNMGDIGGSAFAGIALSNRGGRIGGSASANDLSNFGAIGGSVSAGHDMNNEGSIGGAVTVGHDLDNLGFIGDAASAGRNLLSKGTIGGAANAGTNLDNLGYIYGSATAGKAITSSGTIWGSALAGTDLHNVGAIGGWAIATNSLTNSLGVIRGSAIAGSELSNSGQIDGQAVATTTLTNSGNGRIGASAFAGDSLNNEGTIDGSVVATTTLRNTGSIWDAAFAGSTLDNAGLIRGQARAGDALSNTAGIIGGEAVAGTSVVNTGTIWNWVYAGTSLNNTGTIQRQAIATTSLNNAGAIWEAAMAGQDLRNAGSIGGTASAGTSLGNTGSISGAAWAATSLSNAGAIREAAMAGQDLSNTGSIGAGASAGTSLSNTGSIGGAAWAGTSLSNASSSSIGGAAWAATSLRNAGSIGGSAVAGLDLVSIGHIGGSAWAGTTLANSGAVDGSAFANTRLINSGSVAGSASAGLDLHNSGSIGALAWAGTELVNTSGASMGQAIAGAKLSNFGAIQKTAMAATELHNRGSIGGDAQAGTILVNISTDLGADHLALSPMGPFTQVSTGSIAGTATAGTHLDNQGKIAGSAFAGTRLDNVGEIVGSAIAGAVFDADGRANVTIAAGHELHNSGTIRGDAQAGAALHNLGSIGGAAITAAQLDNAQTGFVGGAAIAGARWDTDGKATTVTTPAMDGNNLVNAGTINGGAWAGASIDNAGIIRGGAQAQGKLTNVTAEAQAVPAAAFNLLSTTALGTIEGAVWAGTSINNAGTIHGSASSVTIDNSGQITGSAIASQRITNTKGGQLATAEGDALVAAPQIVNSGTIGSDKTSLQIVDLARDQKGDLVATGVQSLDNRGGTIRAGDGLLIQVDQTLDNSRGTIQATGKLTLSDPKSGATGTDSAKTLTINNAQGRLSAGESLSLQSASLSRDGTVASGGDFSAALFGDYTHSGGSDFFTAAGSVDLRFSGAVVNQTDWSVDKGLTLEGASVTNLAGASLRSQGTTRVWASQGDLVNEGARIHGTEVVLHSADLFNSGGTISGTTLQATVNGHADNRAGRIDFNGPGASTLTVWGDLHNDNGRIDAGSLTLTVDGNVSSRTLRGSDAVKLGSTPANANTNTQAGITARSGDLVLDFKGNFDLLGSELHAQGNLAGWALGDITGTTLARGSDAALGASIHAGQNLSLIAGGHASYSGIDFSAGGQLTLGAVTGDLKLNADAGQSQGQAQTGATLKAGAGIELRASNDLIAPGLSAQAGQGALTLMAGHDLKTGGIAFGGLQSGGKFQATGYTDDKGNSQGILFSAGLGSPFGVETESTWSAERIQHGLSERANVPYNSSAGTLQLTAVRINGEPLADQSTSGTPNPLRADITLQSKGNLTLADVAIQGKDLKLISTEGNLSISGSREHQEWSGSSEQYVRDIAHASTLKGDSISLSAGRVNPDQTVAVRGDIRLQHVELDSSGLTQLRASGDIVVDPGSNYSYDHWTTSSTSGWLIKKTTTTEQTRESTTVNASHLNAGTLDIQAKGDVTFTATELSASTGTATVLAGGAINYLAAHNQNFASDTSQSSSSFLGLIKVGSSSDSHSSKTRTALVTSVQSEGDVLSNSQGGDTTLAGTRIQSAQGTVTLQGQRDVLIQNVHNTNEVTEQHQSSSLNLFSGRDLLSNTKTSDSRSETSSTVVGASVSAGVVKVIANNNLTVTGSAVSGEIATTLLAGNNLIVESAQDTHTTSQAHTRNQSGFMLSGLADGNPTVDLKRSQSNGNSVETSTQVASTVGSNKGDTTLTAQDGLLAVVGSHLNAGAVKTLSLQGAGVLLTGALNTENITREQDQRSTNLYLNGLAEAGKGPDQRTKDVTSTNDATLASTTLSGHTITITAAGTPGSATGLDDKGNSVSYTLPSGVTLAGTQITLTPGAGAGAANSATTPGSLSLDAGAGALHFDVLVSTSQRTSEHTGRDHAYQNVHNQGTTTQSAHYNSIELNGGTLQTKADAGTVVQIGQVLSTSGKAPSAALFNPDPSQLAQPHAPTTLDTTSAGLQASIAALAQQPGLAYVQQLTTRDPVTGEPRLNAAQWQAVDLAVDKWDYKKQGLTPEGAIIVAAVVSYFTAGAASGAASTLVAEAGMTAATTAATTTAATTAATTVATTAASTAATGTVALSATGTILSNALAGAMASLAGQAAVSLINNQGNIGATLRDLGSRESVRGLVSSMLTAGLVSGLNEVFSANGINIDLNANAKASFGAQLQANLIKGVVGAGVNSAINGTSYRDGLKNAIVSGIVNTIGAQAANAIGDAASGSTDYASGTYTPAKIDTFARGLAHAVLGCALGAANAAQGGTSTGGGCGAGALGGVVGELSAGFIDSTDTLKVGNFAKLMSVTAVALAGGDAAQMNIAATTGENAALNNRQLHPDERKLIGKLAQQKAEQDCHGNTQCVATAIVKWTDLMQRVAEGQVDDAKYDQNLVYFGSLVKTTGQAGTEGARGGAAQYFDDLKTAQMLLASYTGQGIVVRGQTVMAGGDAQTYFSASPAQRADPYANALLGQLPGSIVPGMNLRDDNRLERLSAMNGTATPIYPAEELVLGGAVANKVLTGVSRVLGELDVFFAGNANASARGTVNAGSISAEGLTVKLSSTERGLLGQLDGLPSTAAQGDLREYIADSYFTRNGYTRLDGKCGSGNCFDGVYIKGDQVIINEVKPLNGNGSISLNGGVGKLPTQMTDGWILDAVGRLNVGTAAQKEVAADVERAIYAGKLIKVVTGVDSNGLTIVKLN